MNRQDAPTLGIFPSLDPFEGMMGRPMSLNGYSWVEGNPVTNVDPSGKCMDLPCEALPPSIENAGYLYQNCRPSSNAVRECALECLSATNPNGTYTHSVSYCDRLCRRTGLGLIADQIRWEIQHLHLSGVEKFVWISDRVAMFTEDRLEEYLIVMNDVLLGWSGSSHLLPLQLIANQGAVASNEVTRIGSEQLHCDYSDGTNIQINYHIWAFIAGQATREVPGFISRPILDLGTNVHEFTIFSDYGSDYSQPGGGASYMDWLADLLAIEVGDDLHSGRVSPSNFGNHFRYHFTTSYLIHLGYNTETVSVYDPDRGGLREIYYSQLLHDYYPIDGLQRPDCSSQ